MRGILCGLIAATLLVPSVARADDDPWLSGDKAAHFVASAGIAAGAYGAGTALFDERAHAAAFAASVALAAGLAKEGLDLAGSGQPSARDLVWDGLGTIAGIFIVWSLDGLLARR